MAVNAAIVEQAITIQPGPEEGKDSFINTDCPDCMVGDAESLYLGDRYSASSLIYRVYLQFNLSSIPAGADIDSALLKIYQYDYYSHDDPQDFTIGVHRLHHPWQEETITWDIQCGFEDTPESTCPVTPNEVTWLSWISPHYYRSGRMEVSRIMVYYQKELMKL